MMYEYDSNVEGRLTSKANMLAIKERKQFGLCVFTNKTDKLIVVSGIKDE